MFCALVLVAATTAADAAASTAAGSRPRCAAASSTLLAPRGGARRGGGTADTAVVRDTYPRHSLLQPKPTTFDSCPCKYMIIRAYMGTVL